MHPARAIKVFISYSHKDEGLRAELEAHLKLFKRNGLIDGWHDRRIAAGSEWKDEINSYLEDADLTLLLVSADFLNSDYCYEVEMTRALDRHKHGQTKVIPIIVRKCEWHEAPFANLLALPRDGVPVNAWPDRDSAWSQVAAGIREVLRGVH